MPAHTAPPFNDPSGHRAVHFRSLAFLQLGFLFGSCLFGALVGEILAYWRWHLKGSTYERSLVLFLAVINAIFFGTSCASSWTLVQDAERSLSQRRYQTNLARMVLASCIILCSQIFFARLAWLATIRNKFIGGALLFGLISLATTSFGQDIYYSLSPSWSPENVPRYAAGLSTAGNLCVAVVSLANAVILCTALIRAKQSCITRGRFARSIDKALRISLGSGLLPSSFAVAAAIIDFVVTDPHNRISAQVLCQTVISHTCPICVIWTINNRHLPQDLGPEQASFIKLEDLPQKGSDIEQQGSNDRLGQLALLPTNYSAPQPKESFHVSSSTLELSHSRASEAHNVQVPEMACVR